MTSRAWLLAACATALLLAACRGGARVACGPAPAGTQPRGTTAGVEWVVLPASQAGDFGLEATSYWFPAGRYVRAALERIRPRLVLYAVEDERATGIADRLSEYRCQAVGFVRAGRRLLHLSFFRTADVADEGGFDWTLHPLVVYDGGDAFWQVDYDPVAGTLLDLWINGEA